MTDTPPASAAPKPTLTTASILAVGAMIIFGYVVVVLTVLPIPAANEKLLFAVVGFLGGSMVGVAYGAYFSTSKSAEARELLKSQALADQASTAKVLADASTGGNGNGTIEGAVTIEGGQA